MTFFERLSALWLAAALAGASLPHTARAAETVAHLSMVRGDVKVDGKPAESGAALTPDSVVETGDGKAAILIGRDTIVHADVDTRIEMKDLAPPAKPGGDRGIALPHGSLRALIRTHSTGTGRFTIRTKSATMGVRGSEVVSKQPEKGPAFFMTLSGSADVIPAGMTVAIPLGAGETYSGGDKPQKITASQARIIAAVIARQRGETYSMSDVQSAAKEGGDSDKTAYTPPTAATTIQFDPLKDGAGKVMKINVSPTSKKE